jgi:hypothetical protein
VVNPEKRPTADAILDCLADLLVEADEALPQGESIHKTDELFTRVKELIDEGNRKSRFSRAREWRDSFEAMLRILKSDESSDEKRHKLSDTFRGLDPERFLVFNRRLEHLTAVDMNKLQQEARFLELWNDFCNSGDEEEQ